MKIYWSTFLSLTLLLALAGCGAEQFGSTPQEAQTTPDSVSALTQASCSNHTLIKPQVDILYVVDNSTSSYHFSDAAKSSIQSTINSISPQFDYRVIGTPLLETSAGNQDYQVMIKSDSSLPSSIPASKIVTSPSSFNFFQNLVTDNVETGLDRVISFITSHQSQTNGLFRQGAHLIIVLVSNGRDNDVEYVNSEDGPTGPTYQRLTEFNARKNALLNIKSYLNNQQMRFFSVTAHSRCIPGYIASDKSYGAMSQAIYDSQFSPVAGADHFELCSGNSNIGSVFSGVNSEIQQVIIPHKYKRWPITFTIPQTGVNLNELKVFKSSPSSAPTLLPVSAYTLKTNSNGSSINTRIEPLPEGEPTNAQYYVEFNPGNEITYPECVQISTFSNTEYFGYVVIARRPKLESVILKINGRIIPQSSTNGWSYVGEQTRNIKVNYMNSSDTPVAIRSGHMIQLNGGVNFYKSGDNVEIYYVPTGV